MGSPQSRHRPRRMSQLTTGMLSKGRMDFPHFGQWEAGNTMDLPSGIRQMQTLRKLPIAAPKTNAIMSRNITILEPAYEHVSSGSKAGSSKMARCKAPEIPRTEAYWSVRRRDER